MDVKKYNINCGDHFQSFIYVVVEYDYKSPKNSMVIGLYKDYETALAKANEIIGFNLENDEDYYIDEQKCVGMYAPNYHYMLTIEKCLLPY